MKSLKKLINRLKPPIYLSNAELIAKLNDPGFKMTKLHIGLDTKALEAAGKLNDAENFTDEAWEQLIASQRRIANGGVSEISTPMRGGYSIGVKVTPRKIKTFGVKRFIAFQLLWWLKSRGKSGWKPKDVFDTTRSYFLKAEYREGLHQTFHKYLWSLMPKLEDN